MSPVNNNVKCVYSKPIPNLSNFKMGGLQHSGSWGLLILKFPKLETTFSLSFTATHTITTHVHTCEISGFSLSGLGNISCPGT